MNREHDKAGLHRYETAQTAIATLELLANETVADTIEACTVIAIDRTAEQAELGNLANQVAGKLVLFKRFAHNRNDAVVDETAHGVLDHDFVVGEFGTDVVKIERIQCLCAHGVFPAKLICGA